MPPPPHTHPTLPFCPYLQSSTCNSELISSFQIRTRSVELTLKKSVAPVIHRFYITGAMCRVSTNNKHVKEITADDYWQEWPGLDDSASQWHGKTILEGFPSTQLLSSKLRDRQRNWCKKGDKKGEKVWDWVNSVHPCHMSLVYQFPHSSDTQKTSHAGLIRPRGPQSARQATSRHRNKTNVCCRLSVYCGRLSLHTSADPHFNNDTLKRLPECLS